MAECTGSAVPARVRVRRRAGPDQAMETGRHARRDNERLIRPDPAETVRNRRPDGRLSRWARHPLAGAGFSRRLSRHL